jgi:hypothetical protein
MKLALDFQGGEGPPAEWRFTAGSGTLLRTESGLRLLLPQASRDVYSDAQLDDFHGRQRDDYRWRPPVSLQVRARFSHEAKHWPGTGGFGFWNAPFATERATPLALRAPNVLWFFAAGAPTKMAFAPRPGWTGRGFFGQSLALEVVRGLPGLMVGGGLAALQYVRLMRGLLPAGWRERVTEEPLAKLDITAWHDYEIEWLPDRATLYIDNYPVLKTNAPPPGPLALVIWVDNQWAALGPPTGYTGGLQAFEEPHWLELAWVRLEGE